MDQTPFFNNTSTNADLMHSASLVIGFFDQLYIEKERCQCDFGNLDSHRRKKKKLRLPLVVHN